MGVKEVADHSAQAMMSRTGSFPLSVALSLLRAVGHPSPVVFDPFCGKGTTLFAARLLGFSAYGVDVAPEAVACTAAKLADVTIDSVSSYLRRIRTGRPCVKDLPASVKSFFHKDTLVQLLSIRNRLLADVVSTDCDDRQNATFVLGCLLGILHGHASYSLSIASAHAYSMSADYVRRYAREHKLKAPLRDVKTCLLEKASRVLREVLPKPVKGVVRLGSALNCIEIFPELVGKVDVILTSPPYLNAQTYAKDNWLRLWLLGYDFRALKPRYIETGSVNRYRQYMMEVFTQFGQMLNENGSLICVAGDVRLSRQRCGQRVSITIKTGEILAKLCEIPDLGLQSATIDRHFVPSNARYFHSLSKSNGHAARRLVERVVHAQKRARGKPDEQHRQRNSSAKSLPIGGSLGGSRTKRPA